MPLLPRKNSLDYNPDATILASKKLSAIALENLKNPVDDPDQSTLSTLQAQKQLGDTFDKLEEMAGNYHSLVLRLGSLLGKEQSKIRQDIEIQQGMGRVKKVGKKKMKGGAGEYDAMFPSSSGSSSGRSRRSSISSITNDFSLHSVPSNFTQLSNYLYNLASDRQRFRDFYRDDDRNSSATISTGSTISPSEFNRNIDLYRGRETDSESGWMPYIPDDATATTRTSTGIPVYPFDDPNEPTIDDEDNSTIPTRSSFFPGGGDGGAPYIAGVPERAGEKVGANFNSLIFPIIQLTRRMNILINSRIKPAISSLSQSQASRLTDIYQMVRTSYNDVVFPDTRRARTDKDPFTKTQMPISRPDPRALSTYGLPEYSFGSRDDIYFRGRRASDLEEAIIEQNQFGDEILSVWNTERKNLLLNLTTIINSWRQNTPTGQQTSFNEDVNRSFQQTASRLGKKAELVEAQGQQPYAGFDYQDVAGMESVGAGRKPRGRPKKTGAMTLVGNGRNFYGDQINTSRDIPTIWSGAMRSCPTKYLL